MKFVLPAVLGCCFLPDCILIMVALALRNVLCCSLLLQDKKTVQLRLLARSEKQDLPKLSR